VTNGPGNKVGRSELESFLFRRAANNPEFRKERDYLYAPRKIVTDGGYLLTNGSFLTMIRVVLAFSDRGSLLTTTKMWIGQQRNYIDM
jgi:hypothetical protein